MGIFLVIDLAGIPDDWRRWMASAHRHRSVIRPPAGFPPSLDSRHDLLNCGLFAQGLRDLLRYPMKRISWLGNLDAFRFTQLLELVSESNESHGVFRDGVRHLWTEFLEPCLGLFIQRIEQLREIVFILVLAPCRGSDRLLSATSIANSETNALT